MSIAPTHLDQLRQRGYVVVPNFLSAAEVAVARENFLRYYPSAEELAATPERYGGIVDDPEHLQTEFPFVGDVLNDISTHAAILDLVAQLLGTDDIRLSQAAIWAKYAGTGDFEQALHLDYQGNTLVVPREDGDYRQVNCILYYGDVGLDMGPTYVVSREHTRDLPPWPTHRPRRKNADLYQHERPILAAAGTLFVFGMSTWHRASAITAEHGARFSHHLVYRAANHDFQGYHQYSRMGESEDLQRFIQRCTPRQRHALGFPKPGNAYWNERALAGVALRYPSLDLSPYRAAAVTASS